MTTLGRFRCSDDRSGFAATPVGARHSPGFARMEERNRLNADGSRTTELHLWFAAPAAPARPRRRAADASAGAPGELRAGTVPGGNPPVYRSSSDPDNGAPEVGGLPAASKGQSTEPDPAGFDQQPVATQLNPAPEFIDARSLRISGRDQRGRNWEAMIYGGSNAQQPRDWPQLSPGDLEPAADALRDLVSAAPRNEVAGLGQLQKLLDLHYRR
jgi:hypothetical protein